MKKLLLFLLVTTIFSNFPYMAGDSFPRDTEKELKNLYLAGETQSVPEYMKTGLESIVNKDISAYLKFITADNLEGRDTATAGYDLAAGFISTMFSIWEIKPAGDIVKKTANSVNRSYFQAVPLKEITASSSRIIVDYKRGFQQKSLKFYQNVDYKHFVRNNSLITTKVVFVGYGINEKEIKFNEYRNIDVKGKVVMMLTEFPGKDQPGSPFLKGKLKEKYAKKMPSRHGIPPKVRIAKQQGAVAVLLVENSPQKNGDVAKKILSGDKINDDKAIIPGKERRFTLIQSSVPMPWESAPTIRISREMADGILNLVGQNVNKLKTAIEKKFSPQSFELNQVNLTIQNSLETRLAGCRNVLGYLEGQDDRLKDEVIILGAHLDHLGKRGDYIFNGAADNGSGCVAVMEIAQALALNPVKPKRSILFALWTGEEKGLLGSRYYVDHPFFSLNKTVCYLNLDMVSDEWTEKMLKKMSRHVGMTITEDILKKINIPKFMSFTLCYSDKLEQILVNGNKHIGFDLYLRKTKRWMGGSDYTPFAQKQIPWIFFMSGITEHYHKPSDSFEKVNIELIKKITRLVYITTFTMANTD